MPPGSSRAPTLVHERASLALAAEALRVVVVADTHSAPHPKSTELISREKPDAIFHAGDIGDLSVIDRLGRIAPTLAVRGNIDAHTPGVPDVLTVDVLADGESIFRLILLHIAVYGAKLRSEVFARARDEGASLVVCGHSHVPFVGRDRDVVMFNPGSIGPRRFHLPILFGVIELERSGVKLRHVDCETGDAWTPGRRAPHG